MSTHATATFEMKSWDEKPYHEVEGEGKLTRASVGVAYQGDLEGEGTVEYLMVYAPDGQASFVGLERIVGRVAGKSGSFIIQHTGTDDGTAAKDSWFIVPGSATGDLRGLHGRGSYVAGRDMPRYPITFEYDFQ